MPAKFRKCIAFGNAVCVPSHSVLSLLSLRASARRLPRLLCQFLRFSCLLLCEQYKSGPATKLAGMLQNRCSLIDPSQILCPTKYDWQALCARTVPNNRPNHPPPPPEFPHACPHPAFPAKLKRCVGGGPGNLFVALKDGSFVDNATKRQLKKQDQFVALTEAGVHWTEEHRQNAILYGVIAVVAIIAIVAAYSLYQSRSASAATAFGQAMEIYQTPLATPGQEPRPRHQDLSLTPRPAPPPPTPSSSRLPASTASPTPAASPSTLSASPTRTKARPAPPSRPSRRSPLAGTAASPLSARTPSPTSTSRPATTPRPSTSITSSARASPPPSPPTSPSSSSPSSTRPRARPTKPVRSSPS